MDAKEKHQFNFEDLPLGFCEKLCNKENIAINWIQPAMGFDVLDVVFTKRLDDPDDLNDEDFKILDAVRPIYKELESVYFSNLGRFLEESRKYKPRANTNELVYAEAQIINSEVAARGTLLLHYFRSDDNGLTQDHFTFAGVGDNGKAFSHLASWHLFNERMDWSMLQWGAMSLLMANEACRSIIRGAAWHEIAAYLLYMKDAATQAEIIDTLGTREWRKLRKIHEGASKGGKSHHDKDRQSFKGEYRGERDLNPDTPRPEIVATFKDVYSPIVYKTLLKWAKEADQEDNFIRKAGRPSKKG